MRCRCPLKAPLNVKQIYDLHHSSSRCRKPTIDTWSKDTVCRFILLRRPLGPASRFYFSSPRGPLHQGLGSIGISLSLSTS